MNHVDTFNYPTQIATTFVLNSFISIQQYMISGIM